MLDNTRLIQVRVPTGSENSIERCEGSFSKILFSFYIPSLIYKLVYILKKKKKKIIIIKIIIMNIKIPHARPKTFFQDQWVYAVV